MEILEFFAPCPRGLEGVCAIELKGMGIRQVRPLKSGVAFFGSLEQGYRACLWSRTASRVLLVLARADVSDADDLYRAISAMAWDEHLRPDGSLAVDAKGTNDALRNTQFIAVKVKDAVCDYFRERYGVRPDVNPNNPDIRINVTLHEKRLTVSLDLAGESLHRRGYRTQGKQVIAPLKEALASGMLLLAGWPAIARRGGAFIDPLCGSGTLVIEAAFIAGDIAPGIMRATWGFTRWTGHDADVWERLLDEADARAQEGRDTLPPLVGSDDDARSIKLAQDNAKRALLADRIEFKVTSLANLEAPHAPAGLIATNPPYGERLSTRAQLPALYAAFSSRLRSGFDGYTLAVITSDEAVDAGLGLVAAQTYPLFNGKLKSPLRIYHIGGTPAVIDTVEGDGAQISEPALCVEAGAVDTIEVVVGETIVYVAEENTQQFAARLKKMYSQRRKWARKNGISCYRVYDADLPDYAVAIDIYCGEVLGEAKTWVHVAEYAPPKEIDPAKAARRLADIMTVIPVVLAVTPDDVFLKVRQHGRGGSQYGRKGGGPGVIRSIQEDFLTFEINLSDYLDTGIFLDHRLTRELVFEKAERARFLNLFAYTGTASVHAAAGGAFTTTTVDISQTYLSWARRNMANNGFEGESHEFIRADCVRWVNEQRHTRNRWDFVFCDVPTFSNSSKMGGADWDVQRDHVEFLIDVSRLLTRSGTALFSCNLRTFKPDLEALLKGGVVLEDITAQTIPLDFERNPKIHHCYMLRRS
jgi:23S rRNA (guanine2445-N2)-methyltransferase / 23S rRNA (guanine2069-N7)-methyltransferase